MPVKRSNPQAFKTLNANLEALASKELKVGWFETSKYPDGTPVAYVAAINELGKHKRPFMGPTVVTQQKHWMEVARELSRAVLAGRMTVDEAMKTLGVLVQGDISKTIANVYSPPLSPITLMARKWRRQGKKITGATIGEIARLVAEGKADTSGVSTKPLEDSGYMSATLTHTVEDV